MCNCCNGVGHEFVSRGMKCRVVIRNSVMTTCLPNNATDLDVEFCPICGRHLNITQSDKIAEIKENLAQLRKSITEFAKEMEEYRRTALDVAKYVVNTCIAIGHPISDSCLQHILYELYKAALRRGEVLFYEEFQATPVGPRIPSVYDQFCAWGACPITMEQKESDNPKKQIPEKFQDLFNVIICASVKLRLYDWLQIANNEHSAWHKNYDAKNKIAWIRQKDILAEIESTEDEFGKLLKSAYDSGVI